MKTNAGKAVTPIIITSVAADHPLAPHIRPEGTAAALVCGYGSDTPTAIRYLGEAWPLRGATWVYPLPPR